ncbi:MAG: RNA polymerase sigma factor [Candidatus Cyclobacteriaceae bacterium M3_2C_046]
MAGVENDLIDLKSIKAGDDQPLINIYKLYRQEFVTWALQRYKMDKDDAIDIFQDAIICFQRNIFQGKLEQLNSSLKTYLYGIGKNLIRDKMKKNKRMVKNHHISEIDHIQYPEVIESIYSHERSQLVFQIMKKVQEPCLSILKMFYYQSLSMKEIAEKLNYKNENVAKTQKLRCLNLLKKKVKDTYKKDDLF